MNTSARKPAPARERTRIGSDDARRWVRRISLRNPYAKSILMAVANYMNEDGAAWPGLGTISQDTDITEDTIASRLRWCESIGAIVVLKCWVDENGRRNYEKRGRPTSSEIRFLFDAEIEDIEAAARDAKGETQLRGAAARSHAERGDAHPSDEGDTDATDSEDSTISARHGRGLPEQPLPPASPQLAPDQPPPGAVRSLEPELEDSPPLPPSGGSEAEPDGWKEFQEAYPNPILRQSLAHTVWRGLTPTEREMATKAARGYGQWLKVQRKPPNVLGAHLFLKERDAWPQYAERSETVAARKTVSPDCDEAKAYIAIRSLAGAAQPIFASDGSLSLPRALSTSELAFAKMPARSEWRLVEEQKQQASWLRFFEQAIPAQTARRPIIGDHRGSDGQPRRGFLAPWPWPPTKEGNVTPWPIPKANNSAA